MSWSTSNARGDHVPSTNKRPISPALFVMTRPAESTSGDYRLSAAAGGLTLVQVDRCGSGGQLAPLKADDDS